MKKKKIKLRNLVKSMTRYICWVLYYTVGKHLPQRSMRGTKIRWLLCKILFYSLGKGAEIRAGVNFGFLSHIEVGDHSELGINCQIMCKAPLLIGNNVLMGPDVIFIDQNHKFELTHIPIKSQGHLPPEPICIEDDVWIGARVIILPGVNIRRGVVIAAGSIVTNDVDEYWVVGGNPARKIRKRGKTKN